jgi:2-amino-4-hydroxy-6-hydroxymethyldihydropteridine diphosphokinase
MRNEHPSSESPVLVYIGLGSNLQEPVQQVRRAIAALEHLPQTQRVRVSSLYRSPPMGPADQPDYINAVAMLETTLSAQELLRELQNIEARQGRVRGAVRWGARTLDLDILLYGQQTINTEQLTIPHAGLHQRPFVLYPLQEIAPTLTIPGRGGVDQLIARCPGSEPERLQYRYE